jgi:hypothetical protein
MIRQQQTVGICQKNVGKRAWAGTILCAFVVTAFGTEADPTYEFHLTDNHQPELCSHMEAVFNRNFQHMWRDPSLTPTLDAVFSSNSEYAFTLLPGTPHDTRMTVTLRYSKIPSSPEFDAIQWREGHSVVGGGTGAATDNNNSYLSPYLVAYVDIDNDGILDTVVKASFSRGYAWMFSRGSVEAGTGEMLLTYRNAKVDESMPLSELLRGPERLGKPLYIDGSVLRPFIYQGRTYVASYQQGFGETPTKRSLANLKRGVPPHERMFVSAYSFKADVDTTGTPQWTENTLCAFDMIQSAIKH